MDARFVRRSIAVAFAAALLGYPLYAGAGGPHEYVPGSGLVLHEWGTFTSFAGSDGALLEFSTDPGRDLPAFVYTRERFEGLRTVIGKSEFSLQRMETPVIYFYADAPVDVKLRVDFPKGVLTEFYPHARRYGPPAGSETLTGGFLDWGRFRVIPETSAEARDAALAQLAPGDDRALAEHYLFARETDSALVRVCTEEEGRPTEHEKFLFYRGIGSFALPVAIEAQAGGRLTLRSSEPLGEAFALEVTDDLAGARFAAIDGVAARGAQTFVLPGAVCRAADVADALAARVTAALVRAGLYEKEARAMVKTWRSSWFASAGTRVLYVVPQAVTDAILPLQVEPAPREVVRVLLGRAEVLTPEREAEIAARVRAAGKEAAAKELAPSLGRFTAAAIARSTSR